MPKDVACSGASTEALNAAIDATVEKGVVFVVAAGNVPLDTSVLAAPQNNTDVIVTSSVVDADGLPSHSSDLVEVSCGTSTYREDVRPPFGSFGDNASMASPSQCGVNSQATPLVSAAAAILASKCNPNSGADVRAIADTLIAEGNTSKKEVGGWEDNSGDGHKEPLLDLGDEKVFDPVMVGESPPSECGFAPATPVAAYSFDEGTGATAHDSAANHDGTIEGATWSAGGKYGAALNFDGSNDLVKVADAADLDLTDSLTLEAWVKPDTLTMGPLITKAHNPGSGSSGYQLSAHSQVLKKPVGYLAASGTSVTVAGPSALSTGTWWHLALTSDGTDLRLYVNGELVKTAAAIDAAPTSADLEIGVSALFNSHFDGLIDEIRVYDHPLSQSQIEGDRDEAVQAPPSP